MAESEPNYDLTDRELAHCIWSRLQPYRKRIVWALILLVLAVPFINFHPLVWGFVADALVEEALTPGVLAVWLVVMFLTYLVGLGAGAVQSYLLENDADKIAYCIGETTANEARKHFKDVRIAKVPTVESVIELVNQNYV